MSLDDLAIYLETKSQQIEDELKHDLNMRYYQAIMTMAEKPHKAYQMIYNNLFKKQSKEMTEEEMERMSMNITIMFGGKINKPQKEVGTNGRS